MLAHKIHSPNSVKMECKPKPADKECLFCGTPGSVHGGQCRSCGTWFPSTNSFIDPRKSKFLKKKYYAPRTDGINDAVPDDQDELDEYSDLLQELEVDLAEEDQDTTDDMPPTMDDLEGLPPWR